MFSGTPKCLISLALLIGTAGCEIPKAQLDAYTSAFDSTRATGEEILLDYGAAKIVYDEELARNQTSNRPRPNSRTRLAFDPKAVADPPSDHIMVRVKVWETVGHYNEALTTLAEGRKEAMGAASDNLLQSISSLASDANADLVPFGGVIKTALQAMQRARDVATFRKGVMAADPLVRDLTKLLVDESLNFYNVRLGLRNLHYSARTDRLSDIRLEIESVLAEFLHQDWGGTRWAIDVVERANSALNMLPDWNSASLIQVPTEGSAAYTAAIHGELAGAADEIETLVREALTIDQELLDFRDVLINYVHMLREMRATHSMLTQSAQNSRMALPPPQELIGYVVAVRQSLNTYRNRR